MSLVGWLRIFVLGNTVFTFDFADLAKIHAKEPPVLRASTGIFYKKLSFYKERKKILRFFCKTILIFDCCVL